MRLSRVPLILCVVTIVALITTSAVFPNLSVHIRISRKESPAKNPASSRAAWSAPNPLPDRPRPTAPAGFCSDTLYLDELPAKMAEVMNRTGAGMRLMFCLAPGFSSFAAASDFPFPHLRALHIRDVPLCIGISLTEPFPFWFLITDPAADHDVSQSFARDGVFEGGATHIFYHSLRECCHRKPAGIERDPGGIERIPAGIERNTAGIERDPAGIVLDVGGNFGWHAITAAALGCTVYTFEPVPDFTLFLHANIELNQPPYSLKPGFGRVTVAEALLSDTDGNNITMVVPNLRSAGIWGVAGVDGLNTYTIPEQNLVRLTRPSLTLDHWAQTVPVNEGHDSMLDMCKKRGAATQPVCLLKVDVEGHETEVLRVLIS